jgi:hypothetical protein
MKLTLTLAALLTLGTVSIAAAQEATMDATKMTCADLMAMDATGMMEAGATVRGAMMEDENMAAMTDEEVTKMAEEACKMHPDAMVMDAMKM